MQVLQAFAHLNKELPYLALRQGSSHLPLQIQSEVTILAQFHHNIDLFVLDKRVMIAHNVRRIKLTQQFCLLHGLIFLSCRHLRCINLLQHILLFVILALHLENNAERTLAQLIQYIVGTDVC